MARAGRPQRRSRCHSSLLRHLEDNTTVSMCRHILEKNNTFYLYFPHTHTYQRRLVLTEPKEETTTGLLWVWSSWEPAAGPHARSIHQFGFVSVHQLCEWVIAFEVHCTSVCVCVSSTVPCSCSNTDTHLQIQMAKHSTRLEANSRDSVQRVFTDSETCRSGCEINTGAGTPFK